MLLSELLYDHRDALKAKEGKVADLCQGMEKLSAAGKAATEEISRLKVDLSHEAVVRSSLEKELAQLSGELEKKGLKILKRDSELQQKEFALQTVQQELEKIHQHAEGAETTLRLERDTFEETECLEDDLSRALIAQDEAEAHKQEAINHCQRVVKVFKFKKYKERYEDGK